MVIALMASTLHRAGQSALDEETLEEESDQHRGKNGQHACCEHRAIFIELRLAEEAGDHDWDRLGIWRRGEDQREQELVPPRREKKKKRRGGGGAARAGGDAGRS